MISWLVGVVVCLALLAGCGGGQKGALVKADPVQPEITAPVADDSHTIDAALTEELSGKRLEELYRQERHSRLGPQPGKRIARTGIIRSNLMCPSK